MSLPLQRKRLFGMALDPADDPWSIELKQAWMMASENGVDGVAACLDPYDAITDNLGDILSNLEIELAGKFPVPSWLRPKPEPSDFPFVTAENIGQFYDVGGVLETAKQLQVFVREKILPAAPIMVGVDHSATMGVISALAEKYGPEMLSVIVLDQHFDAIPLSVRVAETANLSTPFSAPLGGIPLGAQALAAGYKDQLSCGDFWAYLLDEGRLLPKNLSFIGVGDYPGHKTESQRASPFQRSYLSFEEKGCRFFPLERFQRRYVDSLARFIGEGIKTPYVYVSLDLDVGSYNFTWAARYMDRPGISAEDLLCVATQIRNACRPGSVDLVGLDIMEFNMHFLGIETEDGVKDSTLAVVGDYILSLCGSGEDRFNQNEAHGQIRR